MKKAKISLYVLTVLALAAVVWLVLEFAPMAQVETPPVVLPTVAPEQSDNSDNNPNDDGTLQELEVTRTNVKTVIASLARADSYHRTLTSESFWENGSRATHTEVWVRGDSVRMVISSEKTTENVLITDGELYIWGEGGDVYVGTADSRDADEYQRLATYEDILEIPDRLISEAGYIDFNGSRCIYAVYTDELLGYKHRVYISVSTGLVMGDETFDGDTLIFNQTSSDPEIITPEDEVFAKPKL